MKKMSRSGGFILGNEKQIIYICVGISMVSLIVALGLAWYTLDRNGEAGMGAAGQTAQKEQLAGQLSGLGDEEKGRPEVEGVVRAVSKHMLLPDAEMTVATVTDADSLRVQNPLYFQYVKNGDRLIYYMHGIIIYDTENDRIVDVVRFYPKSQ